MSFRFIQLSFSRIAKFTIQADEHIGIRSSIRNITSVYVDTVRVFYQRYNRIFGWKIKNKWAISTLCTLSTRTPAAVLHLGTMGSSVQVTCKRAASWSATGVHGHQFPHDLTVVFVPSQPAVTHKKIIMFISITHLFNLPRIPSFLAWFFVFGLHAANFNLLNKRAKLHAAMAERK